MKIHILNPVNQGVQYFEKHGNVQTYSVTVKGTQNEKIRDLAGLAAADKMSLCFRGRNVSSWLRGLLRREEYSTFTVFTFAEII